MTFVAQDQRSIHSLHWHTFRQITDQQYSLITGSKPAFERIIVKNIGIILAR